MHILRDAEGTSVFDVYDAESKPTGLRISYLHAERNGQDFTWGFDPDVENALTIAIRAFEQFLDVNGGKEVPDA